MRNKHIILLLVIAAFLAGCASPSPRPSTATNTVVGASIGAIGGATIAASTGGPLSVGALTGGVIGGLVGHFATKHKTLLDQLRDNGIQAFQVGDQITLVLPSDRVFLDNGVSLNTRFYPALDKVVELLNQEPGSFIKVVGYTDNVGSVQRNFSLSVQQAHNVANYLWDHGLDSRVLYAKGEGECSPIASNQTASGRATNRRIEIKLRVFES